MLRRALLAAPALALVGAGCQYTPTQEENATRAKNVILFIGDGMGVSTVTAARIFDGQSRGESGEENLLSFERFPHLALVKTYNTNQQVPDSAGTATAMATGTKTRAGVINIGPGARRRDCAGALANPLESLGELAKEQRLAVGVVTTARLTHATPASVYAHSAERDWESDRYMRAEDLAQGCSDIAQQFVDFGIGGGIDIALGGGAREFRGTGSGGERRDPSADLLADWLSADVSRRVVRTALELRTIDSSEQVLGLFAESHLTYLAERPDETTEPTLSAMTVAAIRHLETRADGYFLMVEGGRIDHGHHDGKPGYALLEAQAFSQTIAAALEHVDLAETLVLVTADHSHVFGIAGYPVRGNPILGLVVTNDASGESMDTPVLATDGKPYTTLGYLNGPGAIDGPGRPVPETGIDALAQSLYEVEWPDVDIPDSETHGGEDVPLYAIGNGAARVAGVIEQDVVFDIIVAAFGWQAE